MLTMSHELVARVGIAALIVVSSSARPLIEVLSNSEEPGTAYFVLNRHWRLDGWMRLVVHQLDIVMGEIIDLADGRIEPDVGQSAMAA